LAGREFLVAELPMSLVEQIKLAFVIAFHRPRAYVTAGLGSAVMIALLIWSGGFLQYYPRTGWEFDASLSERISVVVVGVLFGALLRLELAALGKARAAAGAAGAGGIIGPVFGIVSMSCCAPLLAPAILSFVGFSGTTLLNVNATLHELSTPLTLTAIVLLLVSVILVSRTVTASCELPVRHVSSTSQGERPKTSTMA
jgi:hypothetical protein